MKNYLSTIVFFVFMASGIGSQAAVVYNHDGQNLNIFGRAQAGALNGAARDDSAGGIEADARIGIIGRSSISTNISAVAHLEWEVDSWDTNDKKAHTRYAYTGVDFGPFGVVTVGQQDTAAYQTVGFTDVFERWGGEGSSYWDFGGRQEGQLAYVHTLGGYTIAASYQSKFDDAGRLFNHDTGNYYNADIKYGFAGAFSYNWERDTLKELAFSLSTEYYKFDESLLISGRRSLNAALSYGRLNEGLYTALLYNRTKFAGEDHHQTGVEAVAGYVFENGFGFMGGYAYTGYDLDLTDRAYINAQASYNFTEAFRGYVESRFGLKNKEFAMDDRGQRTLWTASIQYTF